jgi:hypothetical protein
MPVEKWNIPKEDFGVSCTKLCYLGKKEKEKRIGIFYKIILLV